MKKEYISPEIEVTILETKADILAGSTSAGGVTDGGDDWESWL